MHMHIDMTKVLRLANKTRKRPLMDFFGKWPGNKEELDKIKNTLERDRKKFKLRDVNL